MSMKGTVRYENYNGSAGGGMRNHRKRKLAKERKETAIASRIQKQHDEKMKNIAKNRYAKEAKEWSERYES